MKAKPRTLADFKSSHDKDVIIPRKIQAAIDTAAKVGPEHYIYESELIAQLGLSQSDFGKYKGQFEKHIVPVDYENGKRLSSAKRAWFPNVKLAAKLRGE